MGKYTDWSGKRLNQHVTIKTAENYQPRNYPHPNNMPNQQ